VPREGMVLFVDDDASNRTTFEFAFADVFDLLTTSTGEAALELLESRNDIAIVLADHRMPRMTGVDLCERVAERFPDIIRIILTAYADVEATIAAINRGRVHRYVRKPYRNDDLTQTLQLALQLHASRITEGKLRTSLMAANASARAAGAEVAHELRNFLIPLTHDLADLKELPEATPILPQLTSLHAAHESVLAIARDLVTTRRDGASCDAATVGRAITSLFASSVAPIALELTGVSRLVIPMAATHLAQCLANLISNAANALREVTPPNPHIRIHVAQSASERTIEVIDNGPGVPSTRLSEFFAPRANHLGLRIVRRLVEDSAGSVRVSSEAGTTAVIITWKT